MQGFKKHAFDRMKKRFSTVLTLEDRSAILAMVRRKRCVHLYNKDRTNIVAVWYDKKWIPLVYNPDGMVIVTILPPDVVEKYHPIVPYFIEISSK